MLTDLLLIYSIYYCLLNYLLYHSPSTLSLSLQFPLGRRAPCDIYWHGVSFHDNDNIVSGQVNKFPGVSPLSAPPPPPAGPERPPTNAAVFALSPGMALIQLTALVHVYSVFCNHNRRDLAKTSLILVARALTSSRHGGHNYCRNHYSISETYASSPHIYLTISSTGVTHMYICLYTLSCPCHRLWKLLSACFFRLSCVCCVSEAALCLLQGWMKCWGRLTWAGRCGPCRSCSRKSTTSTLARGSCLRSTRSLPHRYMMPILELSKVPVFFFFQRLSLDMS